MLDFVSMLSMMYLHNKKQIIIFSIACNAAMCLAAGDPGMSLQGGVVESPIDGALKVKVADFDGDGHLDICVVGREYGMNAFAVLYGDGAGLFSETIITDFPEQHKPMVFEVVDLNQDGALDIVIGATFERGFHTFHSVGNRQFEYQDFFGTTGEPRGLAAADLNGDGDIDLAVSCEYSHTVEIFISDGAGGYENTENYTGMTNPRDILFADLDQDQDLDMVVGHNSTNGMSVRVGFGDGTFGDRILYGRFQDPAQHTVRLVDLNNDGDLDVVTVSRTNGRLIVRFGNLGNASFLGPNYINPGALVSSLVLNDFDSDGHIDIVTRSAYPSVVFLKGTAGVSFEDAQFFPTAGSSSLNGVTAAVGDMNEDGYDDLVMGQAGEVQILFHSGACLPDTNADNQLNFWDVSEYINMFTNAHPIADLTSDGRFNFFDVSAFLNAFALGCP